MEDIVAQETIMNFTDILTYLLWFVMYFHSGPLADYVTTVGAFVVLPISYVAPGLGVNNCSSLVVTRVLLRHRPVTFFCFCLLVQLTFYLLENYSERLSDHLSARLGRNTTYLVLLFTIPLHMIGMVMGSWVAVGIAPLADKEPAWDLVTYLALVFSGLVFFFLVDLSLMVVNTLRAIQVLITESSTTIRPSDPNVAPTPHTATVAAFLDAFVLAKYSLPYQVCFPNSTENTVLVANDNHHHEDDHDHDHYKGSIGHHTATTSTPKKSETEFNRSSLSSSSSSSINELSSTGVDKDARVGSVNGASVLRSAPINMIASVVSAMMNTTTAMGLLVMLWLPFLALDNAKAYVRDIEFAAIFRSISWYTHLSVLLLAVILYQVYHRVPRSHTPLKGAAAAVLLYAYVTVVNTLDPGAPSIHAWFSIALVMLSIYHLVVNKLESIAKPTSIHLPTIQLSIFHKDSTPLTLRLHESTFCLSQDQQNFDISIEANLPNVLAAVVYGFGKFSSQRVFDSLEPFDIVLQVQTGTCQPNLVFSLPDQSKHQIMKFFCHHQVADALAQRLSGYLTGRQSGTVTFDQLRHHVLHNLLPRAVTAANIHQLDGYITIVVDFMREVFRGVLP